MASVVVQFRIDEEKAAYFRKKGMKMSEVGKEAVTRFYRRLRAEEKLAWFREHPLHLTKPAAQLVREDRDSH